MLVMVPYSWRASGVDTVLGVINYVLYLCRNEQFGSMQDKVILYKQLLAHLRTSTASMPLGTGFCGQGIHSKFFSLIVCT